MSARLIVSLSGLSDDASLEHGAAFTARMQERGVPVSQLLRPAGVVAGSALARFFRERRDAGDALVLHGYDHSHVPTAPRGVRRRAEFAALPRHEAGLRLTAARRVLTSLDLRSDVFVPPRWLASTGTVEALTEQGFRVLADETTVRLLQSPWSGSGAPLRGTPPRGGLVERARVLGFRAAGEKRAVGEGRAAAEAWRARLLLAETTRTARHNGLVRINVRAKDLRRDVRLEAAIAAVDAALELGAAPMTYAGAQLATRVA